MVVVGEGFIGKIVGIAVAENGAFDIFSGIGVGVFGEGYEQNQYFNISFGRHAAPPVGDWGLGPEGNGGEVVLSGQLVS